jgi:hypothetical protein
MGSKLHDSCVPVTVLAHNTEVVSNDIVAIAFIESVATGELLSRSALSICLEGQSVRRDENLLLNTGKGAYEPGYDESRRSRRSLFEIGFSHASNISRMLYQSMLKSASGSHKRPASFPGKPDCLQGAGHAPVRTSGSTEDAMILLQLDAACFSLQCLRGYPLGFDRKAQRVCPVAQSLVSCPMRRALSIPVPYDCDPYLSLHLVVHIFALRSGVMGVAA